MPMSKSMIVRLDIGQDYTVSSLWLPLESVSKSIKTRMYFRNTLRLFYSGVLFENAPATVQNMNRNCSISGWLAIQGEL